MSEHEKREPTQTIDGALYNADEALRQLAALTREASRRAELLGILRERGCWVSTTMFPAGGLPNWYVQAARVGTSYLDAPHTSGHATEVDALEAAVEMVGVRAPDPEAYYGVFTWGYLRPWSFEKHDAQGCKLRISGARDSAQKIAEKIRAAFPDVGLWSHLEAGEDLWIKPHPGGESLAEQFAREGLHFQPAAKPEAPAFVLEQRVVDAWAERMPAVLASLEEVGLFRGVRADDYVFQATAQSRREPCTYPGCQSPSVCYDDNHRPHGLGFAGIVGEARADMAASAAAPDVTAAAAARVLDEAHGARWDLRRSMDGPWSVWTINSPVRREPLEKLGEGSDPCAALLAAARGIRKEG